MSTQPKSADSLERNHRETHTHKTHHERAPLRDLESYPEPFVKTEDLARYWSVSRRQIYKQIENGSLPAIRVGPRTLRIPTREAADFEKRLMLSRTGDGAYNGNGARSQPSPGAEVTHQNEQTRRRGRR